MAKVQEVTITKQTAKGSNRINYNVDLNGKPFGQIWTYKAKGEKHLYQVYCLNGFRSAHMTYDRAEEEIRGQM